MPPPKVTIKWCETTLLKAPDGALGVLVQGLYRRRVYTGEGSTEELARRVVKLQVYDAVAMARNRNQGPAYWPGHNVHPIQASKAFEDRASWKRGMLIAAGLDKLTVEREDGETRHYGSIFAPRLALQLLERDAPIPVALTERWHVLMTWPPGMRSVLTNVVRLDPDGPTRAPAVGGRGEAQLLCIAEWPCDVWAKWSGSRRRRRQAPNARKVSTR